MNRRGPRSRGHAALSGLAVSPPKQESTSCLSQTLMSRSLFLHIRNSSAVKNNRWWCWWRSVLFLLLFDPECSVNKGQRLQQFTGCSQSSTEVSNICCLTVASSAGVCWSLWAAPTITTQSIHRKLKMTCICFWEVKKVSKYCMSGPAEKALQDGRAELGLLLGFHCRNRRQASDGNFLL